MSKELNKWWLNYQLPNYDEIVEDMKNSKERFAAIISGEYEETEKTDIIMDDMQDIKVKDLKRVADFDFQPDKEYLESMPDIQNSPYAPTIPIERVGIHNFHMPMMVRQLDGGEQEVIAQITGMVSLEADKAGINMSRIIRTAYKSMDDVFDIDTLCTLLENYRRDLDSFEAHIIVRFPYRLWQEALRSVDDGGNPEGGWKYYNVTFDVNLNRKGEFRKLMYIDFVYSSACPCSAALSEHAALTRGVYGIPHSQRSVARICMELSGFVWIESVIDACRKALLTETLVFCKRQDEQAFAELNGAQPKFVEDAARIIATMLNDIRGVRDYKVVISHLESLHDHQAISVILKGLPDSQFTTDVTFDEFESLTR